MKVSTHNEFMQKVDKVDRSISHSAPVTASVFVHLNYSFNKLLNPVQVKTGGHNCCYPSGSKLKWTK